MSDPTGHLSTDTVSLFFCGSLMDSKPSFILTCYQYFQSLGVCVCSTVKYIFICLITGRQTVQNQAVGKISQTSRFFSFLKSHKAVRRNCFAEGEWDQIRPRKRVFFLLQRALSVFLKSHIATYW